LISL
jgi:small subunit ribosomal protein S12e